MLKDQIFEWNSGQPKPMEIPDWARESYRKLVAYLMAQNYRVPEEMAKKAEEEC